MSFLWDTVISVAQLVVGFYGFWLVWRVLLPILPGPRDPEERIAPFDSYFTDPFVLPLSRRLRLHQQTSPQTPGSVAFLVKQVVFLCKRAGACFQAANILALSNSNPARP